MTSRHVPQTVQEILKGYEQFIVPFKEFTVLQEIGRGSYGVVYKCRHNPTGLIVAVKKLFTEKLEGIEMLYFCREVTVLMKCRSPFLLRFLGYTATPPYCIVTDYIPGGTLYAALQHQIGSRTLTPTQKTIIAMEIASGMMSLHEQNAIHRDLKSLNILLTDDLHPKVCDFGTARYLVEEEEAMTNEEIGTPAWMAPEVFKKEPYSFKVDVYSFGVLLWELLTETTPFKDMTAGVQVGREVCDGKRPPIPPTCPEGLRELIILCWDGDPSRRPMF